FYVPLSQLLIRSSPISSLFPYTTLFRSGVVDAGRVAHGIGGLDHIAQIVILRRLGHEIIPILVAMDAREITAAAADGALVGDAGDRKSTRLNSSHDQISYAVFCLKKKII